MIEITITDDDNTVIMEFVIERNLSGETNPIRLSDEVKDFLEMKFIMTED